MIHSQTKLEMPFKDWLFGGAGKAEALKPSIPSAQVGATIRTEAKLQAFLFPQGFEDRLMKEQGWTRSFAKEAQREYLKYMAMAANSSKEITPSEVIDKVWHQHLVYSKSYWNDLCSFSLGKEIHHNPGTGSATDQSKYNLQYRDTLQLYEAVFGSQAPRAIWPLPEVCAAKPTNKPVGISNNNRSDTTASSPAGDVGFWPFIVGDSCPDHSESGSSHDSGGDSGGGASSCGSSCSGGGSSCGGGGD